MLLCFQTQENTQLASQLFLNKITREIFLLSETPLSYPGIGQVVLVLHYTTLAIGV